MGWLLLGNVDWNKTRSTTYQKLTENRQFIETTWGKMPAPEGWRHIALRPTCPGEVGWFWTGSGFIMYEYGMFAPKPADNLLPSRQANTDTLNGQVVTTVLENGEVSFYVPSQKGMTYNLAIYPSKMSRTAAAEVKEMLVGIHYKR